MGPSLRVVLVGLSLGVSAAVAGGHGRNFEYVEESFRLPPDTTPPGTSTTDVDLVDVDDDGDLDLFTAEGTDSPEPRLNRLFINDGHGFFADETASRLPPLPANSTKADFADVDGDGDLDAVVGTLFGEMLLLNDGNGAFANAPGQLPAPQPFPFDITADARFADVDGDGHEDILVSNENPFDPSPTGGAQDRIWINDGTGFFNDETAARLPADTDQTGALLPGDIDDDGDTDLVKLNRGQELVLINDGDGFFADETAARFPVTDDSSRGGVLADLDGDCDLDLVVGNSRTQPVALYFNDGDGFFDARNFGMTPLPDETDSGLEAADVDRDGDLDVYLPNAGPFIAGHGFGGGPDRYFENNGRGKFKERTSKHFTPPADPSTDAEFGDIDGDGDLDLVVGNSGENGGERVFIRKRR